MHPKSIGIDEKESTVNINIEIFLRLFSFFPTKKLKTANGWSKYK